MGSLVLALALLGAPADTIAGRVDAYLARLEALGFSGATLVAVDGEIVLEKGYGPADRETRRPVRPGTVFSIGSITKPFTALTILSLADSGELLLDDPLTRFFDDVPPDKAGITIRNLLTHTAGFPGAIGDDADPVGGDAFVRQALATPLEREPGARYGYSNVGYSLLGRIAEEVTGRPYEAALRERVLEPASMTRTGYRLPPDVADDVAVGYRGGERWGTIFERPLAPDGAPGWHLRANGGLHSTVGDLYRLHVALERGGILEPSTRAAMESPQVPENPEGSSHYGFGWAIFETPRGTRLVAHNGGNGVLAADFLRYVEDDVVVIVLSNTAEWPATRIASRVAALVFDHDVAMPPEVAPFDKAVAGGHAGTYRLEDGDDLEVRRADGALVVVPRGPRAAEALSGTAPGDEARAFGARVLAARRAADAGDYGPLHAMLGDGMSIREIEEREGRMRERMEGRLGPRVATRLAGIRERGGEAVATLEIEHERGSRYLHVAGMGEHVHDLRLSPEPVSTLVYPATDGSWFAFDVRDGVTARVRFEEDGIVVLSATGEPRAMGVGE